MLLGIYAALLSNFFKCFTCFPSTLAIINYSGLIKNWDAGCVRDLTGVRVLLHDGVYAVVLA